MNNFKIKISIIMPSYNSQKYIEKSIEAFISQKYENKELIIVDGKSTDGTHEIIKKYMNKNLSIKWIKEIDFGISDAINIGINNCTGDIIGYLGADDILYDGILNKVSLYSEIKSFDAIYFDSYNYYVDKGQMIYRKCPNIKFNRENLLKHGTIVGLEDIFFSKFILEKYRYNPQNRYSMDYELYLEIFSNENPFFVYINQPATINIFDENITYVQASKQSEEAFNVALKYSKGLKEKMFIYKKYYGLKKMFLMLITKKLNLH